MPYVIYTCENWRLNQSTQMLSHRLHVCCTDSAVQKDYYFFLNKAKGKYGIHRLSESFSYFFFQKKKTKNKTIRKTVVLNLMKITLLCCLC